MPCLKRPLGPGPIPVANKCPGNSDGPELFTKSDKAPAAHGAAADAATRFALKRGLLVKAQDIRDALRQAEARGATDFTAVSREE